ncbi:MAG: hypothetical protein M3406_02905, partial [Chloroflexota bacterium]|nr:hypothetical protein [Chloroflexota bacterium]
VKALDRYLRLRARHRFAALPWLWLVMALAGWRSREMLSRYAKSAERERHRRRPARQRRRPAVAIGLGQLKGDRRRRERADG